jgi:tyrosyl-tRNA synthetase
MPSFGLEPKVVLTTPLLEGTDGVQKMSKSLGNYVGVTEPPPAMFAKVLSISDTLMWRYYELLTDLTPAEIEAERSKGQPMASKIALARRIVSDFNGPDAAAAAEAEWSKVHRERQAPSDMKAVRVPAGTYKPHELLARAGLTRSNSEGVRLVRQGAVRRDGSPVPAGQELRLEAGDSLVLSIGPARFVRIEVP